MALTPDRNHEGPAERAEQPASASPADARGSERASRDSAVRAGTDPAGSDSGSMLKQLADAGLDLTGHPLAGVFGAIDGAGVEEVSISEETAAADEFGVSDVDSGVDARREISEQNVSVSSTATAEPNTDSDSDRGQTPAWASAHPLLSDTAWSDLSKFAPEVTTGITTLMNLDAGLRSFERPMGPDEALLLIDGVEALSRINEALSTLALSVCERVGVPADSGAKDAKSLIRNRLNLTPAEAHRRAELAKTLGGRVDMTGQALEPLCPQVSEGLHNGSLSAGQAKAISDCMKDLPNWVTPEQRTDVEQRLVGNAPGVRVGDLRGIFDRMLAYIDPDGAEPREETKRSDYSITMRPKANGDWVLGGLLDPVSGSALNGLLTSRIQSAEQGVVGLVGDSDAFGRTSDAGCEGAVGQQGVTVTGIATSGAGIAVPDDPVDGPAERDVERDSRQQALFDVVDSVLRGDRYDASMPDLGSAPNGGGQPADLPAGFGARADGTPVDLTAEQPSARAWIYERFATLISRISMNQAATGSPYALVITAKAEDLARGTGEGTTGVETPVPIQELTANGLNGAVFFHLMSEKARTVQVMTEKRFANKKQIAIITARDQGCTFPGCDAPPGWCEANHVVPWALGGRTDINNLALACSAHHHLLDRSEWEMVMLVDGRPAWRPPATVDPERRPILHPRFIAAEIIETLFDDGG